MAEEKKVTQHMRFICSRFREAILKFNGEVSTEDPYMYGAGVMLLSSLNVFVHQLEDADYPAEEPEDVIVKVDKGRVMRRVEEIDREANGGNVREE